MKIKTINLIDLTEAYDKIKGLIGNQKMLEKDFFIKEILTEVNVRIYHPFDKEDFYIRLTPENHKLKDLMKVINTLETLTVEKASNTKYIKKINETNSFIYGKINVEIRSIEVENFKGNLTNFFLLFFNMTAVSA